jgi:hypothetical protein
MPTSLNKKDVVGVSKDQIYILKMEEIQNGIDK